MAIVLGYGGVRVLEGDLSAGALFVFIGLLTNFFDPVQQAVAVLPNVPGRHGRAGQGVRGARHGAGGCRTRRPPRGCPTSGGGWSSRDVHFSYRPDTAEVLHGISFAVEAGQTVALVRPHRGPASSTIVKLLARFYDPHRRPHPDRRP